MPSYDEKFTGQKERYDAKPDSVHTEKMISSNTQGMDMHIVAPANETYLNKAVKHLERETQRGEHAPMVGGYKHDHTMR